MGLPALGLAATGLPALELPAASNFRGCQSVTIVAAGDSVGGAKPLGVAEGTNCSSTNGSCLQETGGSCLQETGGSPTTKCDNKAIGCCGVPGVAGCGVLGMRIRSKGLAWGVLGCPGLVFKTHCRLRLGLWGFSRLGLGLWDAVLKLLRLLMRLRPQSSQTEPISREVPKGHLRAGENRQLLSEQISDIVNG